jgi:TnpA family transposase
MTRLAILTEEEQVEFDYPPMLSVEARALCFAIPKEIENKINFLRTPTNQVGFLLQYGYFKASKRFFITNRFRQEDIEYAAKLLGIPINKINFSKYKERIPAYHQKTILEKLEYKRFENERDWIKKEIARRVKRFIDPRQLFFDILQLLYDHHIELPSYHRLSDLITEHYLEYEEKLIKSIKEKITKKEIELLDKLLEVDKPCSPGLLSRLKIINQSTKPKAIDASLNLLGQIEEILIALQPIITALTLTASSCSYYAIWVQKAKLSQIKQFFDRNKTYLHLIAFIQHQYYLRQDTLVDILLRCVQSSKNTTIKNLNKAEQLSRSERKAAVRHLTKSNRNYKVLINDITEITKSPILTDSGKVKKISELIAEHEHQKEEIEQQKLELFEKSLDSIAKDKDYFDILEKLSIKLQHRVAGILKAIAFNESNSDKALMKAISNFVHKDGRVTNIAPADFLEDTEKEVLMGDDKVFRSSLYKILLFIHVADAIKSGELNLKYSYRYLSIQDYLVDEKTWSKEREELLRVTGLERFADHEIVMAELKQKLNDKYQTVNERFLKNRNPYLCIDKESFVHVTTPALPDKDTEYINALLAQVGYVPILQVLSEINDITHFAKSFKHHSIKNVKQRPRAITFMAGIIGLGCNIGIPKMAQISTGINENTLSNAVNWYFSKQALDAANQCVLDMINKLALSSIFVADMDQLHTSGDGSKFNVGVESLLASNSFKYFGQGKGVSVYTFIDERQALFHSLVMSASEREAAYVIDGLNNVSTPKISIHSTDTHGYTEAIFAATHFMNVAFGPRLKNLKKQKIYSFSGKATHEKKGYQILPSRTINQDLIANYWQDILRFMVTIKLKNITASQLFKRLSSYARNNPLYKAIKEFGRIIKSMFVLTYYDDTKLRQRIEKQLNRIELSNKFGNAVFYANNGEFKQALQGEQEVIISCRVLIQNAIVLWNYLYLSQLLTNCADDKERTEMINMIKEGSIISWAHVNLHGEFDFRKRAANDTQFNMDKIMSLKVVGY